MIICSCNVFSDHEVRTAVAVGAPPRTTGELFRYLGCSAQCGRCAWSIKAIMDARKSSDVAGPPRAPCPMARSCGGDSVSDDARRARSGAPG
jgi:bacterioferritin-associated ferredoxin